MIASMSIYVTTAAKVKGAAWAAKYPKRAADLFATLDQSAGPMRAPAGTTEENHQ